MASAAGTRSTALIFAFSAALFLLLLIILALVQPPHLRLRLGALADLPLLPAAAALGRGRLLDLATRGNMVLLCHAILLLILRDAGVLSAPAARRRAGADAQQQDAACSPSASASALSTPLARHHHATKAVVWRRPRRNYSAAPVAEAAEAAEEEPVDEPLLPDDDRDRAAIVPLHDEHPAATSSAGETGCFDHVRSTDDAMSSGMELADDRTFEEFIRRQRREMRQESLRLLLRPGRHQAIIAAC